MVQPNGRSPKTPAVPADKASCKEVEIQLYLHKDGVELGEGAPNHYVATIKRELEDANTGVFSNLEQK